MAVKFACAVSAVFYWSKIARLTGLEGWRSNTVGFRIPSSAPTFATAAHLSASNGLASQ